MKKISTLRIIYLVLSIFISFAQVDAQCAFTGLNPTYCTNSPPSSLVPGMPGGVFTGNGVTGSVFNPALAGPGTHTVNYAICTSSYVISQPAFAPSPTTGVNVPMSAFLSSDDGMSGAMPIGFTFNFYCTPYTSFYISTNGFITFLNNAASGCCSGGNIPTGGLPNNMIAYAWTDLYPGNGGTITYSTTGSAPNRTLTVSFVGIAWFNGGNGPITSQIKLAETTNIIEIHTTTNPGNANYVTTMGIQNMAPSTGTAVTGRNAVAGWTATNDCQRFTPSVSCSVTQTTTVNAASLPVTGNSSICIGATSNLSASANNTYTWSTGSNAPGISVAPTVNTTYTVGGTNSFGCISNAVVTVTVDNTPTITPTSSNGTAGSCPNTPLTLVGSGATTYTWTGGITNGVAFTPTISANYVVTGSNACGTSSAAISISIHPLPPVTASINNPTICSGSPVILNGGGAVTYTWTPSVTNNVAFVPGATGNYTVRGTSALGCTASAVAGVTVLITPVIPPVVTPTAICFGAIATLSATGATGYTWTPGPLPNAPSVTVSPVIGTTFTLTRTNGACASTATVNLIVHPLPIVAATASPSQICAGQSANIVIVGPITNTTFPGGFTASNLNLYPNSSTNYTVIGSNGNCTLAAVVPVVVNPSPAISIISSTNTICEGTTVSFTTSGANNFTWSPSSNTNNSTEFLSPLNTTVVTVTGMNSFGCTGSASQLIVVHPLPAMNITSTPQFICANQTAVLSVSNTPNVNYSWSNGSITNAITVNPPVTTNYVVSGTNSVTGCTNSGSYSLAVYISTFAVTSPSAMCIGQTATISASGPATSYAWIANGVNIPSSAASVTVAPLVNTNYVITGITGSCSDTQTINVIVNPLPNVTASVAKPTICRFETATITGTGASTYLWNNGSTSPVLTFTLSITNTYTLTGTNLNGCSKTTTITQFVAICSDVNELQNNARLVSVYPNPNNGNFIIKSSGAMQLIIVNTLGQLVGNIKLGEENKNEVTVDSLPNGIYFIVGQDAGSRINKKIIVER